MRSEISLSAPAKINLSLRVLRRREDGFHEIATRMVPLGLADEVEMRRLEGGAGGVRGGVVVVRDEGGGLKFEI